MVMLNHGLLPLCCVKRKDKKFTPIHFYLLLESGNNFEKMAMSCSILNIGFIAPATFTRVQRLYIIPEVVHMWEQMQKDIWGVLAGENIILCGDGRMDLPGHSAKYCLIMEQFLDVVVDLVVVDKRETGGISTNMEVFALKRLLEGMVGKLVLTEIVTDASTAVTVEICLVCINLSNFFAIKKLK